MIQESFIAEMDFITIGELKECLKKYPLPNDYLSEQIRKNKLDLFYPVEFKFPKNPIKTPEKLRRMKTIFTDYEDSTHLKIHLKEDTFDTLCILGKDHQSWNLKNIEPVIVRDISFEKNNIKIQSFDYFSLIGIPRFYNTNDSFPGFSLCLVNGNQAFRLIQEIKNKINESTKSLNSHVKNTSDISKVSLTEFSQEIILSRKDIFMQHT